MGLRSAFESSAVASRSRGIALSSALLAVPLLVAHPGAATLLLAASVVGAAAFLERRPSTVSPVRAVPRQAPGLALVRAPSARACARWELVERDGRRFLVMRWH